MKKLFKMSFFIALVSIAVLGCNDKDFTPDRATGKDVTLADLAVSDVFTFTTSVTSGGGKATSDFDDCYDLDINVTEGITTITFKENAEFPDGIKRSGKIIINWHPGWLTDSTKSVSVSFDKFKRDGNQLEGKISFMFTSAGNVIEAITKPGYKFIEENMILTLADNKGMVKWSGVTNIKWDNGFSTILNRFDDEFLLDVVKNGVNRNGEEYKVASTNVKIISSCGNVAEAVSGKSVISKGSNQIIINYGDGQCDNSYTITQNGVTITVP